MKGLRCQQEFGCHQGVKRDTLRAQCLGASSRSSVLAKALSQAALGPQLSMCLAGTARSPRARSPLTPHPPWLLCNPVAKSKALSATSSDPTFVPYRLGGPG